MAPRLAYSYVRFSTPEQAKGDSYRRQRSEALAYCAQHGLKLADDTAYEDLGRSAYRGDNLGRGALGDFLQAVEDGKVPKGSVLLVESLDRVSRQTTRKAIRTLEEIVDAGVEVVTLIDRRSYTKEILDDDPMAMVMAVMIFIRAHEESKTKSVRGKAAWSNKRATATKQRMTKSAVAWLNPNDSGGFDVIEERAAVVRDIFRQTLAGVGYASIAQRLNASGVAPWGRGVIWHRSYIQKILTNPAVIGEYQPHTMVDGQRQPIGEPIQNYYPAIIDPEDFAAVQSMKTVGKASAKGGEVRSLMAGLARCGLCGGSMARVSKGSGPKAGHPRLVCRMHREANKCEGVKVRQDSAETALLNILHDPKLAIVGSTDRLTDYMVAEDRADTLKREIDKVAQELLSTPSDTLRQLLLHLEEEHRKVTKEAEALADALDAIQPPMPLLAKLRAATAPGEINAILRRLASAVVIYPNSLTVRWKVGGETDAVIWSPV